MTTYKINLEQPEDTDDSEELEESEDTAATLFENHPVLNELLHIDHDMAILLADDIMSGRLEDWDSREQLIACMKRWDHPDLQIRIDRAISLLKQNAKKA